MVWFLAGCPWTTAQHIHWQGLIPTHLSATT